MSISKNTYVIVGYDFTKIREKIFADENESFLESDVYQNLICNQVKGEIQFFDDPMSGDYLYFGYIFSAQKDEWDSYLESVDISDLSKVEEDVDKIFECLPFYQNEDIKSFYLNQNIKLMIFPEYT